MVIKCGIQGFQAIHHQVTVKVDLPRPIPWPPSGLPRCSPGGDCTMGTAPSQHCFGGPPKQSPLSRGSASLWPGKEDDLQIDVEVSRKINLWKV